MISIIITFYDNQPMLSLVLEHLLPTLSSANTEIIVVDDNPNRPLSGLRMPRDKVTIARPAANLGYSGACNFGVDLAKGDRLVFLDSDAVPTPGWLNYLVQTAKRIPTARAISAKILDSSTGKIVAFGAAIHGVDTIHPYRGAASDFPLTCSDCRFQLIPSGTMLIDRVLFDQVGRFDPTFRNAFGDFDLCMRLSRVKRPVYVSARAIVYHRGSVSGQVRHAHYPDTKALFFKKWAQELDYDGLRFLKAACSLLKRRDRNTEKRYLAVNLSSSLFWEDYIETAREALNLQLVQCYSLPANQRNASHIRLEDRLDWHTCRLQVPILYFLDHFTALASNQFWFVHRAAKADIVIDRNGNVATSKAILEPLGWKKRKSAMVH